MFVYFIRPAKKDITLYARGAIVVDLKKDDIVFDKNMHDRLSPASMTKLMSMLLVFEHIRDGKLAYDQRIVVSERATGTLASKAGIRAGEKLTVDDLLKCVFLPSGSDAVLAFAEHLYGDEESFVAAMNRKAAELGLQNTHFINSIGLEGRDQYSSPYDIAQIAKALVTQFPEVYRYTSLATSSVFYEDGTELKIKNTNDMLDHEGVNGLKTGSSPKGGYSLAMTYNQDGKQLLFVVMGNDMPYFRREDNKLLLQEFR